MKKFTYKPNETIGKYQIKSTLGIGSIGEVYTAYKLNKKKKQIDQTLYAIKVLKPDLKTNDEAIKIFENEINAIKKLKNNNIIHIIDVGPDYFVMPYIEGTNIKEWMNKDEQLASLKKINYHEFINKILSLINLLCDALIYTHGENIWHNDLKPSNILITTEGQCKIIDFGLSNLKSKKYISFTIDTNYRPYELKNNDSFFIDIYSLAVISFELFSGELPNYYKTSNTKISEIEANLHQKVYDLYEKTKQGEINSVNDFRNSLNKIINTIFQTKEKMNTRLKKKDKKKIIKHKGQNGYPYMFKIIENKTEIPFYFSLTEKEKPIKIGDGTYGSVFQVHNDDGESCAVKLLYKNKLSSNSSYQWELSKKIMDEFVEKFKFDDDSKKNLLFIKLLDPHKNLSTFSEEIKDLVTDEQKNYLIEKIKLQFQSIALKRFKEEARSKIDLLEKLGEQEKEIPGVITIKGGTENFQISEAYKNEEFRMNFKALDMELSDYAIVMPLYSWTLKDILERGTNSYENEPNGYSVLSKLNFNDRIATMLPFLIDIATGIKSLHSAGLFHHDIKPANIFVTTSIVDKKVKSVVGDLGFLKAEKNDLKKLSNSQPRDSFALGTIHYRAPEQKEYFDISDARISHINNKNIEIHIFDPKFRSSMIEEGDFLFFSRDDKQKPFIIESIDKTKHPIVIKIGGDSQPAEDDRTQIIMYKLQGIRTDLFGIGAIVLDMLTCGRSPERFYETIRSYDNEEGDITQLLELYRQVSTYQADERGLGHIFEPFEDHNEYAPLPIVELILKCMMSRVKNTYHANSPQTEMNYAINQVLNRLKELSRIYGKYEYDDNTLINKDNWDVSKSSLTIDENKNGHTKGDYITINRIQGLTDKEGIALEDIALRLVQGIWYIGRLEELIRKTLKNKDKIFISEMLPDNINITQEKIDFDYVPYRSEEEYLKDLLVDGFYTKIIQNYTNPFVPDSFSFLRKKISLTPIPKKTNKFKYKFLGSSPSADDISPGDIIINDSMLWQVSNSETIDHKNHIISLELISTENNSTEKITFNIENKTSYFIFYKRINPCKYYFKMLGCYLYHIFFVGIGENTIDKPLLTNFSTIPIYLDHNRKDKNIIDPSNIIGNIKNFDINSIDLKYIYQYITYMYLKLTFCENKDSYYEQKTEDNDRIYAVSDDVLSLKGLISNFLGMPSQTRLVDFIKKFNDEETKYINEMNKKNNNIEDIVNFKEQFLSLMEISIPGNQISESKNKIDKLQQDFEKQKCRENKFRSVCQKLKQEYKKLNQSSKKLKQEKDHLEKRILKNRVKELWGRIKKKSVK